MLLRGGATNIHTHPHSKPRGKGTRFTAIFRKSQFSLIAWECTQQAKTPGLSEENIDEPSHCPGKRRQQVTPLMAAETRWFKSPYVGVVSFLSHPFQRSSFKSRTNASVPATPIPFHFWYIASHGKEERVRMRARQGGRKGWDAKGRGEKRSVCVVCVCCGVCVSVCLCVCVCVSVCLCVVKHTCVCSNMR